MNLKFLHLFLQAQGVYTNQLYNMYRKFIHAIVEQ